MSGPAAGEALRCLTGAVAVVPRQATRVRIAAPATGEPIDQGLVLWFPAPASFTGEDVTEFHVHGGPAVVARLLDALGEVADLRPAAAGEFTRRAFDNGKLDLTQVEGLADLINAETEGQRRQALRQMEGDLGRLYEEWRERLIGALAHFEAAIDFPDENLPVGISDTALHNISCLRSQISLHLDDDRRGERLRDGLYIAIVGPPNVGKSSLLNLLARRDAAIVSATAGTTRDVIEVHLDIAGYPVIVADTAGLRDNADAIEGEGVRRALACAATADLRLVVFDAACWPRLDDATLRLVDANCIAVVNKIDLRPLERGSTIAGQPALAVSVTEGTGMATLLTALENAVSQLIGAVAAAPALTRARHREALASCARALGRALDAARTPDSPAELIAEDVRLAARALGRITGRVDVEDVLDVVFEDFCIGK